MQINTTVRSLSHQSAWPSLTCQQVTNAAEGVEKRALAFTVGGNVYWYKHYGKQYRSTQNTKYRTIIWPSNSTLGHVSEQNFHPKNTGTHRFTAAQFTTAKTWKQPKCPSTNECIKNMCYIYIMEYYTAIKRTK